MSHGDIPHSIKIQKCIILDVCIVFHVNKCKYSLIICCISEHLRCLQNLHCKQSIINITYFWIFTNDYYTETSENLY